MTKCTFCGKETNPIKGVHIVKNDGSVDFFCSSKCRKNSVKLKRDKKKFKWTLAFREQRIRSAEQKERYEKQLAEEAAAEKAKQ